MEILNKQYTIRNNNNNLYESSPEPFNEMDFFLKKKYYSREEPHMFQLNEENKNNESNNFNDNNTPINIEENEEIPKNKPKKVFTPKIYDKICSYFNDMKEIDRIVPYCEEKKRRELLLDRGLLLCLKVNEIMDDCFINIDNILFYKKYDNIEIDTKLLDENYWMNQKVDKYARTEQRKRIPQEKWFMIKDHSFTPNLTKCFALNRAKFIDTYNWLNSLENK